MCSLSGACVPPAASSVNTAPVVDELFQRQVTWAFPTVAGIPAPTTITATCSAGQEGDIRTVTVAAPATTVTIAIGDGTGDNAELTPGRTYTCTATGKNFFGAGLAVSAAPFGT